MLLTVGRSEASIRAAVSHTGALVSDVAVVEAACRSAGAHLVSTPDEMIDLAQALVRARPAGRPAHRRRRRRRRPRRDRLRRRRGGRARAAPPVSDLAADLAASLPHTAATRNPVDLAGGGEQDFFSYARVARALLESGEVDGVLLTGYFGGYSQYSEEFAGQEVDVAREVARAVAETGRPIVAQTMYADSPTAAVLRAGSVPVYPSIESAVAALAALLPRPPAPGAPELPAARAAPADRRLLRRRGAARGGRHPVRGGPKRRVRRRRRGRAAELGYPVVVKALGTLHKSDVGGVVVGIAGRGRAAGGGRRPAPPARPARVLGRAHGAARTTASS